IPAVLHRLPESELECRRVVGMLPGRALRRLGCRGLDRSRRRRAVGAAYAEGANRLGDVLDALFTQVLENILPHLADMIAHAPRDANAARIGQRLEPGGNVHAVAEDIAVL